MLVAFFRAGQNGWLDWFGDLTFAAAFPGSSLLLVGVIAVVALIGGWMWDRRPRAGGRRPPDRPDEGRPVRRGYPVAGPAPARAVARRPALTSGSETQGGRSWLTSRKSGFFSDLFAPVGGFGVTFATMFRKVATEEYPRRSAPTSRGSTAATSSTGTSGRAREVRGLRAVHGPVGRRHPRRGADNDDTEGGAGRFSQVKRYGRVYQINYLRCIFCGLCIEACPARALTMTNFYELADNKLRADLIYTRTVSPRCSRHAHPPFPMADGMGGARLLYGEGLHGDRRSARASRRTRTTDEAEEGDLVTGTGEQVLFWVLGPLAVIGALGTVFAKKAVHAAWTALTMIILGVFYIARVPASSASSRSSSTPARSSCCSSSSSCSSASTPRTTSSRPSRASAG